MCFTGPPRAPSFPSRPGHRRRGSSSGVRLRAAPRPLARPHTGGSLPCPLTINRALPAHGLGRHRVHALLTPGLNGRALPGLIESRRTGSRLRTFPPACLIWRTLTRVASHGDDVLGPLQRQELGLRKRHAVALALGRAREVVNRRLPGLPAMANREIQGMEVGVLAHALPALLSRKRSQ